MVSEAAAEQSGAEQADASDTALLAEAAGRSGLIWLRPPGQARAWPAWHVWHEGAVHVVSGAGEQPLPELSGPVDILVRSKESGARLITVPATAERITPDDDRWLSAATALAASRLNSAVAPADLPAHWAGTATVTRVAAAGAALERPGQYDQASGAASPAPASGTTSTWRPWHLGGRKRRAKR